MEAKKADGLSISLPVSDAYLQGSFTFKLTREPLWLDEQLVFLGEIPKVNDFENKKPVGEHCLTDGRVMCLNFLINDLLDVNGWDLQKALRLLHRSNPSVFEWFKSPVVYRDTAFSHEFIPLMENSGIYHYLNMVDGNYREYLRREMVRAKKYFYVLRPLLACRWIFRTNTPPPMRFAELVASDLPAYLNESVQELLRIKMEVPELQFIPKADVINTFIEEELPRFKEKIRSLPEERRQGYDELKTLFLKYLR